MNPNAHNPSSDAPVLLPRAPSVPGATPDEGLSQLKQPCERPAAVVEAEKQMWRDLGVQDLQSILSRLLPLEPLARKHLELHSYRTPNISSSSMVWYEGSFDPIGIHHFKIFHDTLQLGFKHAVFAMVYQNPYKQDSLPYEHRYEMARRVMETAGLKVVDDPSQEGVCIFPPGKDGLNRFHVGRMSAIFGSKNFILIGPDNFEKAMTHDIIWNHIPEIRSSPHAQELFGFRSMYNKVSGFRDRVLVYPGLDSVHSTDIRNGTSPMLGPVNDYVREHGLYRVKVLPVPTAPTKVNTSAVSGAHRIQHSSHLAEEIGLSRQLLRRLQNDLTGLPLSMQVLKENFEPVLGHSDLSQLNDLNGVLTKCENRTVSTPRNENAYFLDKRRDISTELLNELSKRLIGPHIQVTGEKHLSALLQDHQSKIIFVCNESGWGEIPVLTHALRKLRFGALADSATFVFNRPSVFPTPTIAATVGHGVTTIQPLAALASRSTEEHKQSYKRTVKAGLERLSDGPVVLFPEQLAPNMDAFKLSTIPGLFVESLKNYMSSVQDPDVSPSKVYIVPVGIVGGECINSSSPFSSEDPAVVSFGAPVTAKALIETTEQIGAQGNEVVAHMLGFRLAELMPEEWRGCYGNAVDRLQVQEAKRLGVNTEGFHLARSIISSERARVGSDATIH